MESLTQAERTHIADVLRRLRKHFPAEWPGCAEGHEHRLIAFAYYEGCGHRVGWECCRDLLAEAAPFAVGQELVTNHRFRWVMVRSRGVSRYAVGHAVLDRPIDLASLEDGAWNEEEYDASPEPEPGVVTLDSLPTIVTRVAKLQEAEPLSWPPNFRQ